MKICVRYWHNLMILNLVNGLKDKKIREKCRIAGGKIIQLV
jgi:hypothetical protein